jgi:hypothetical protein
MECKEKRLLRELKALTFYSLFTRREITLYTAIFTVFARPYLFPYYIIDSE